LIPLERDAILHRLQSRLVAPGARLIAALAHSTESALRTATSGEFTPGRPHPINLRKGHRQETQMAILKFVLNGKPQSFDVNPEMPLLWVLRDVLNLTGTKYGCGMALCGACTVHVDGEPTRSCVTRITEVAGKRITTIEGLSADSGHPLQRAWIEEDVPQCGYCQSGQLMSAAALLAKNPRPTDGQIDEAMRGNICRCGTYGRIRKAIHRAALELVGRPANGKGSAR